MAWQQRVGAAFQDLGRHQVLLREAVGIGRVPALVDVAAVRAALEDAGAGDLPESLPAGLET